MGPPGRSLRDDSSKLRVMRVVGILENAGVRAVKQLQCWDELYGYRFGG